MELIAEASIDRLSFVLLSVQTIEEYEKYKVDFEDVHPSRDHSLEEI
jgi:hypothetical protein